MGRNKGLLLQQAIENHQQPLQTISGVSPQITMSSTLTNISIVDVPLQDITRCRLEVSCSNQHPRRNTTRCEQSLRCDHGGHLLDILTQQHLLLALQHIQHAACGRTSEHRCFVFQVWHGHSRRLDCIVDGRIGRDRAVRVGYPGNCHRRAEIACRFRNTIPAVSNLAMSSSSQAASTDGDARSFARTALALG